jgi:hypothetical protein
MPARRDRVIVLVCRPPDSRNSPMGRWPSFRREERDPLTARGAMSGTASASITALPTAPSGGPPTTRRGNPQVPDTLRDKHRRPGARVTASTPEPQLIQPRREARIAT